MAIPRVRVLRAVPGTDILRSIVRQVGSARGCRVTAWSESVLPHLSEESDEVVEFGRLVQQIAMLCGDDIPTLATAQVSSAALKQACLQHAGSGSPLYLYAGARRALDASLDELGHWSYDLKEVAALAQERSPELAEKLALYASIAASREDILRDLGRTTHLRQMDACHGTYPDLDGSLTHLLCVCGSEESPAREAWLKWLADCKVEITVVTYGHAASGDLFPGARRTETRLGWPVQDIGDGNRLLRGLFGDAEPEGLAVEATVLAAPDPLAECEWALREVSRIVPNGRAAIYARSGQEYAPLLESAGRRLGVDLRIARRVDLLDNSFAKHALETLEALSSDDIRRLERLAMATQLGLSMQQRAELKSAIAEVRAMAPDPWRALDVWNAGREEPIDWLSGILAWRQDALATSKTMSEWCAELGKLWPLLADEDAFDPKGYGPERDNRARNQMERVLAGSASISVVMDSEPVPLEKFAATCRTEWSACDVSVPAREEGVLVTSDPEALHDADLVVCLGMLEGRFPRRRIEDPIFSDHERQELSRLRPECPPLPNSFDRAEAERDVFYRVAASTGSRLLLCYPAMEEDRESLPAFYIENVQKALGGLPRVVPTRTQIAPLLDDCVLDCDRKLALALSSSKISPVDNVISTDAAKELLAVTPPIEARISVLEAASKCAFQYVGRQHLATHGPRRNTLWFRLLDLPIRAKLLVQPTREAAEAQLFKSLDDWLDEIRWDVESWEINSLRSGAKRVIDGWVEREFAMRSRFPRDEGSVRFEVPFGEEFTHSAVGKRLILKGRLPAISTSLGYRFAHLYRASAPIEKALDEHELWTLSLYFKSIYDVQGRLAVDIETFTSRAVYVLGNAPEAVGDVKNGIQIVKLAADMASSQAVQAFFSQRVAFGKEVLDRIESGSVEAISGDACSSCRLGELCRRHLDYSDLDSIPTDDEPSEEQA